MPNLIDLISQRNTAFKNHDYTTVIQICDTIMTNYPSDTLPDTYAIKGIALFNLKSYTSALDMLSKAKRTDRVNLTIAICYRQIYQDLKAVSYFQQVYQSDITPSALKYYACRALIIIWLKHNDIPSILQIIHPNIDHQDTNGDTLLHLSVLLGYINTLKSLFSYNCNPTIKNNSGIDPLTMAKNMKDTTVIKCLLEQMVSCVHPCPTGF